MRMPRVACWLLVTGLVAGCGGPRVQVTDWELAVMPVASDTQISIYVFIPGSSCRKYQRVEVEEDPDRVVLQARMIWTPGDCTDDIRWDRVTVQLAAPLGERRLLGCAGGGDAQRFWDVDPDQVTDCRDLSPDGGAASGQHTTTTGVDPVARMAADIAEREGITLAQARDQIRLQGAIAEFEEVLQSQPGFVWLRTRWDPDFQIVIAMSADEVDNVEGRVAGWSQWFDANYPHPGITVRFVAQVLTRSPADLERVVQALAAFREQRSVAFAMRIDLPDDRVVVFTTDPVGLTALLDSEFAVELNDGTIRIERVDEVVIP